MKTSKKHRRATAGFSLAELMVVIVIIGLLATLVVPNVISKLSMAKIAVVKADINTIAQGVTEYYMMNNGQYPDSLEALVTENENGDKILDRDSVPKDPWGNEYIYDIDGSKFTVSTYGADGAPGGEGKDRDIDNNMIKNGEV